MEFGKSNKYLVIIEEIYEYEKKFIEIITNKMKCMIKSAISLRVYIEFIKEFWGNISTYRMQRNK